MHRLGANDYLLVVNAGTTEKDFAWIRQQVGRWPGIHLSNYSSLLFATGAAGAARAGNTHEAHQGRSRGHQELLVHVGNGRGNSECDDRAHRLLGEDGFEVYIPSDEATTVKMWNALLDAGAEFGIRPCGLGARNTLRLEAGMSLYGHEISEEINVLRSRPDALAQA